MRIIAGLLFLAALSGCDPNVPALGETAVLTVNKPQFATDIAAVRQARIFFSHHSVGENVIDGVRQVVTDAGAAPLKIAALGEAAGAAGPLLLHGSGGRNGDPESKIAFFEATLRGNPSLRPDLAFMKFCYVDINPSTDVAGLLARYQRAIAALKREHPEIRFAHVTVPLVPRPMDLKSALRRLLGLQEWTDASNVKRHEFNQKLVTTFPSDPVFDLAGIESTGPDGKPVFFEKGGKRIPSMAPHYNADNGHLNASGQRAAGAAAIHFLAAALSDRPLGATGRGSSVKTE